MRPPPVGTKKKKTYPQNGSIAEHAPHHCKIPDRHSLQLSTEKLYVTVLLQKYHILNPSTYMF